MSRIGAGNPPAQPAGSRDGHVPAGYRVVHPAGPPGTVVAHVPHSATEIPEDVRAGILLDDATLRDEIVRMTDWHTERLYAFTADLGAVRLVNRLSRLVIDPERFPDDALESMAAVGQGAVYTRTSRGVPLRAPDASARARLMERYFVPYHAAFTGLVADTLAVHDRCLVLDCHSFPSQPLRSEPDQTPGRPEICIGTDPVHTPRVLAEGLLVALAAEGFRVEENRPFAGAIVPLRHYGQDHRVAAVMLETRRDLYCDEATGAPLPALESVAQRLHAAVSRALSDSGFA